MEAKQINTGVFVKEKEIIEIELANKRGTLVSILNYGTIIHRFVVTNKLGVQQDIVLGFDSVKEYFGEDYLKNYCYLGAIVGRYANRIQNGKFSIDSEDYQLPQNNGPDCLHGGVEGFDKKVWDIVAIDEQLGKVTFQYYSVDGEENFPGDLVVQLSFQLTESDELILAYTADTDEATALNLTHHSYFNLSPTGEKVMKHTHEMDADNYLEQDGNYIVTGNVLPVVATIHDFTKPKEIGRNWNKAEGYDQTYVLNKVYGDLTLASKTTETNSRLTLLVYTTEPVVHLYTAKHLKIKNGKNGKNYGEFDGFCVETQHHPNAINIPQFPSTVLRPDEVYHQTTIYKVLNK